jgi:uncharacterized protein (TIGR00251 family)
MKCRLEVKIVPGSSRSEIIGWLGDSLKIKVAAPPEKGKANQAVIGLLCERLRVSEDALAIVQGATSQRKVIEVDGMTPRQLSDALPAKPA